MRINYTRIGKTVKTAVLGGGPLVGLAGIAATAIVTHVVREGVRRLYQTATDSLKEKYHPLQREQ